jgi:murein DD-endopeptidase MepM/ murein hydrolase activator NlpD
MKMNANNQRIPQTRKKTDTCFSFAAEYQSLRKLIHKTNNNNKSDNYLHILSVYNYNIRFDERTKDAAMLADIVSNSDRVIEQAKAKGENACENLSEIYTLKGIALLYQQKYMSAYQTFDTAISYSKITFDTMNAYLWQAHTSLCMQAYDTTDFLLSAMDALLDTTYTQQTVSYEITAADYYIRTYEFEKALDHLFKLEHLPVSRKLNVRICFIIAQICNELGRYREAIPYYDRVMEGLLFSQLMRPYAVVHKHLCEKIIEEQEILAAKISASRKEIPEEFEPTIVESYHDSSFFYTNYPYYFNDLAAMFFLNEDADTASEEEMDEDENLDYIDDYYASHLTSEMLETIFENWDSVSIHIPKTDFNTMTDTIYLPLTEMGKEYTLPHFNPILSRFGWRRYRYHYGVDTKNAMGDSIFCVFDGIVRIAKRSRTYGNVVIVRHYNGLETFYAHCSKIVAEPNQEVKAGELIALVGSTGRSTGPHLHFETRYKGTAFNPEYMIDFEKGKLISDTLMITKETFNYQRSSSSASSVASSSSSSGAVYYKIRSGDTLSGIAKKYRTNVNNLKKLNKLRSDFIREGQRIRVL